MEGELLVESEEGVGVLFWLYLFVKLVQVNVNVVDVFIIYFIVVVEFFIIFELVKDQFVFFIKLKLLFVEDNVDM